jgi:abequosyltransferase
MYTLTICIPTYNFGAYIGATLDSIINQVKDDVEVLIFDGGSNDNTENVVISKTHLIRNLRYYKQQYRGGVDRDIDSAVCMARGRYCWLISADDIVLPGSIAKILDSLIVSHDLYICEHSNHTFNIKDATPYPMFTKEISGPHLFDTRISANVKKYFESAVTSEPFLGFLSTPIFKRDLWVNTHVPDDVYGTCWIVAGKLLSVLARGANVYVLYQTLLSKRTCNESHIFTNILSQFRIMIINFPRVVELYYPEGSIGSVELRRVLRSEISLLFFLRTKLAACDSTSDRMAVSCAVRSIYSDGNLFDRLKYFTYIATPIIVLKWSKRIIRAIKSFNQ